jgi:acetate kinase
MNNQPTGPLRGTPLILTINGGSSSIKFALFEAGDSLRRILGGRD